MSKGQQQAAINKQQQQSTSSSSSSKGSLAHPRKCKQQHWQLKLCCSLASLPAVHLMVAAKTASRHGLLVCCEGWAPDLQHVLQSCVSCLCHPLAAWEPPPRPWLGASRGKHTRFKLWLGAKSEHRKTVRPPWCCHPCREWPHFLGRARWTGAVTLFAGSWPPALAQGTRRQASAPTGGGALAHGKQTCGNSFAGTVKW